MNINKNEFSLENKLYKIQIMYMYKQYIVQ